MFPFTNNFKLVKKDYTRSIYHTKNTKINECIDDNLIESFIKSVKGIEFSNKHPQKKFFNNELEHMMKFYELYNRKQIDL